MIRDILANVRFELENDVSTNVKKYLYGQLILDSWDVSVLRDALLDAENTYTAV